MTYDKQNVVIQVRPGMVLKTYIMGNPIDKGVVEGIAA
jgi:hypothetical protein